MQRTCNGVQSCTILHTEQNTVRKTCVSRIQILFIDSWGRICHHGTQESFLLQNVFFFFCILTAFLPLVQCLDITQVYSIRSPWVDLGTSIYFQLIGNLDPLAQSMA